MVGNLRTHSPARLWLRLTTPSAAVTSPEDQRRARLLSALQLTLIPLSMLILVIWSAVEPANPDLVPPVAIFSLASMLAVYGLSRTHYYRWGAALLIALVFVAVNI